MYDSPTLAALQSGALILRDMLTVHGKDSGGTPVDFGFWFGVDNVTTSVVSALDGTTVSRNFIGGGSLLAIDPIVWTVGLEVRTTNVTLSQLHADVATMVRGNDIRNVVAEVHRGIFSASTWALVSTPFPRLLGRIDQVTINTPAVGDEGSIVLGIVSNTVELTRVNTAMKSDEQQKLRSSDRFRRYADTAADIQIWWGQKSGKSDGSS